MAYKTPTSVAVAVYAAGLVVHAVFMVLNARPNFDGSPTYTEIYPHGVLLLPVIAFFMGAFWCRILVGIACIPIVVLLLLSPIVQHEVDRTPMFWTFWALALVTFVGVAVVCFTPRNRTIPH